MWQLFAEIQQAVGFTDLDRRRLQDMHPAVAPAFPHVAQAFFEALGATATLRQVLEHERAPGNVVRNLTSWLESTFRGPWDQAWLESRATIGLTHVRIGLPQHGMVTAMGVVRRQLVAAARAALGTPSEKGIESISRALDVELALMLHAWRAEMDARAARAERLSTFGHLVGSIGHELRNPLGVIETSVYMLRTRHEVAERGLPHLDRIGSQVTLANEIITQLLNLIRDVPVVPQEVDLSEVVPDAAHSVARPDSVALALEGFSSPLVVSGDPTQLRQAVVNLVENAVHAAFPSGRVRLQVVREASDIVLTVDDSGPGIDPSVMARLFEPLVTTKTKGIGLGLALVHRIVERHGGRVDAGRGSLGGARLMLRLPGAKR